MLNNTLVRTNESESDDVANNDDHTRPENFVNVNCALNAPLMLISIVGNSLVLAAILRTPSLRSPSTVFLSNLAVSDLLVGLVLQPVFIAHLLKASVLLEHAYSTLSLLACGVSLGTITAISVDRFLALHYHLRYPNLMTIRRALYTSATIWFICFLLSCLHLWSQEKHLIAVTVSIALCILVSTFSYIKIYRIVRQHLTHINAQKQAVDCFNTQRNENNLNIIQSRKTTLNTFIYYVCMMLCYTPVFVSALTRALLPAYWTKAWALTDTVAFLNSSINPFLYCWRTHELRRAVLKTLRVFFILFSRKQQGGNIS